MKGDESARKVAAWYFCDQFTCVQFGHGLCLESCNRELQNRSEDTSAVLKMPVSENLFPMFSSTRLRDKRRFYQDDFIMTDKNNELQCIKPIPRCFGTWKDNVFVVVLKCCCIATLG